MNETIALIKQHAAACRAQADELDDLVLLLQSPASSDAERILRAYIVHGRIDEAAKALKEQGVRWQGKAALSSVVSALAKSPPDEVPKPLANFACAMIHANKKPPLWTAR